MSAWTGHVFNHPSLKPLAAATRRTTLNPRDTDAARDLQLAAEAVATSRTRVESARVTLDHIRVAELLTFSTTDALLGSVAALRY